MKSGIDECAIGDRGAFEVSWSEIYEAGAVNYLEGSAAASAWLPNELGGSDDSAWKLVQPGQPRGRPVPLWNPYGAERNDGTYGH